MRRARTTPRDGTERGMVLVTALLLLIVVTILAVGLFRSFGLDEKIAGNVREKHRAVNAAETAEEYAEWWLATGNAGTGTGVVCAPPLVSAATGEVCSNVLTNACDAAHALEHRRGLRRAGVDGDHADQPTAVRPARIRSITRRLFISPIWD